MCSRSDPARADKDSRLSEEPIRLETEQDLQFAYEEILDYDELIARIRADAASGEVSPGAQIWALLNAQLKADLEQAPAGEQVTQSLQFRFLRELNSLLRRRDLYEHEAWTGVDIEERLREGLATGFSTLPPLDVARRNRELISETFPDLIEAAGQTSFLKRPRTLHIFGDRFLDRGNLQEGFRLPTGAVWQPSLFIFGTYRTALQWFDSGDDVEVSEVTEWAHRADIFFNLALTPTERILLGFRPLDEDGRFTSYTFHPDSRDGWDGQWNYDVETFFFEGDLGEMFPNLDRSDGRRLDYGIAVGRQPLFFQDGIMINDTIDAVGLTRNNLLPAYGSNVRVTGLWGWENINRNNTVRNDDAEIFGLFTQIDLPLSTVDFDLAYVKAPESEIELLDGSTLQMGGDSYHVGISAVQRIGHFNTAFRINSSFRSGEADSDVAGEGTLITADLSWTPPYSTDLVYANGFWAINEFVSAARGIGTGGPLARTGILFEAPGLGRFGSALSSEATDAIGGAIGYQKFFDGSRKQVIFEVGGRVDNNDAHEGALAGGVRYQQAIGQRGIFLVDTFAAARRNLGDRYGFRIGYEFRF